ncbi:deoxyribose-phosphate aldolase [Bowdeniella nasicola]|uniref:Deoxyribose-phosphate aldolase n=1 Tax=Bowdeniella nasicola TaxID=208480 RepID=A0A1H3Z142_9ACTO|nr:deoxyribose-phosphate aldolase [Bowdeniella nasicola]SEA17032.1 deoxyribose-phosphate aldolase [Bowdeniella nasicola]
MTTRSDIAAIIDHTLLKPESTKADVDALVEQGKKLGVKAVCVSPSQLPIENPGDLTVATVVGFPSGAVKTEIKAAEAKRAVEDGADEVDMVVNLGQVKAGEFDEVERDIHEVKQACGHAQLKVIIESAALTDDEIVEVCKRAEAAGADYVKTSTGFHPAGGASEHAVKLMSDTVGGRLGVKASGGIRTGEAAVAMAEAGATRLGLSASEQILSELDA